MMPANSRWDLIRRLRVKYRDNWNAGRKLIVILPEKRTLKGNSAMGTRGMPKEVGVWVRPKTTLSPKLYDKRRVYVSAHVCEARSKLLLCKLYRKKDAKLRSQQQEVENFQCHSNKVLTVYWVSCSKRVTCNKVASSVFKFAYSFWSEDWVKIRWKIFCLVYTFTVFWETVVGMLLYEWRELQVLEINYL